MKVGTFVETMRKSFKVPHVQLTEERLVLGLAEEAGQYFHEFVGVVNEESSSVQHPSNDR